MTGDALIEKWLLFAEGNPDIEDIIFDAIREIPQKIKNIEIAFKENDIQSICGYAHAIKGSYGNLKITEISDVAKAINIETLKELPNLAFIEENIQKLKTVEASIPPNYFAPKKNTAPVDEKSLDDNLNEPRILVADDEPINQRLMKDFCENFVGVPCDSADNGKIALQMLSEELNYKILLLDINMPIMDGWETIHKLRSEEKFNNLIVIALTGLLTEDEIVKCKKAGFNEWLSKPVDLMMLSTRLKQLLE